MTMQNQVEVKELYQAVHAAQSLVPDVRQRAEQYIQASSSHQGYAIGLLNIAAEEQVEPGARSKLAVPIVLLGYCARLKQACRLRTYGLMGW